MVIAIHAIKVFVSTYRLGVGLGSNRSSRFIATLLNTIGIVDTLSFIAIISQVLAILLRFQSHNICNLTFWSLLSLIIVQCIAIPDINFPTMWAFLILTINLLYYHHSKNKQLRKQIKEA
jgi:hypothetical protein